MSGFLVPAILIGGAAFAGALLGWTLRGLDGFASALGFNSADSAKEQAAAALREIRAIAEKASCHLAQHQSDAAALQSEMAEGNVGPERLKAIVEQLIELNDSLSHRFQEADARFDAQSKLIEQQAHDAQTDALTKLPNRRALEWELQRRLGDYEARGEAFTVAVLDVDHFKRLNDTHGHLAGDAVLQGVAAALRKHSPTGAFVARYGGEEFVLVVSGAAEPGRDLGLDRCRGALSQQRFAFEDKTLFASASMGVATIGAAEGIASVLGRADQALYASKRAGRACSHWHDGKTSVRLTPLARGVDGTAQLMDDVRRSPAAPGRSRETDSPVVDTPRAEPILDAMDGVQSEIGRRIHEFRRGGPTASVVLVRIDRFEQLRTIDETAAETLRRVTAQFLVAGSRAMDRVARVSESDFLVLMPGASLRDATRAAIRVQQGTRQSKLTPTPGFPTATVSIGVATSQEGDDADELFNRVRKALEAAVSHGRDRVFLHQGAMVSEASMVFPKSALEESAM